MVFFAAPGTRALAQPARELVVMARAGGAAPQDGSGASVADPRARLAKRLEALGLVLRETLADGPRRARDLTTGAANPFAFDPARVWLVEAADSASAAAALAALAADPDVEWVEPNRVREIAAPGLDLPLPDDPLLRDGRQWGLRNLGPASPLGGVAGADIRALEAWARCAGSNQVLLAVADTGIDPAHPDLGGSMPDGSPRIAFAVNVTGVEPQTAIADSFGHGTPVAGVMAARTNDGPHFDSLGVAGVCGGDGRMNAGCRIVPIKIAPRHSGSATSFAIARAAVHAAGVGARAMNLSFAGSGPSRVERQALYQAITHGCVVVAAAGNHGYDDGAAAQYPAAYAADGLCIQVGASDEYDRRTTFSSYGPGLDLVAPGIDIWTTWMTYPSAAGAAYPGYVPAGGTSFAAPFVTGAVGLLAAARPELTDVDFQHVLRESAHDIGAAGVDRYTGWGRLDAAAALAAVGPDVGLWHDEVAGERFLSLGFDTLDLLEGDFGTSGRWRGKHRAELIEVTATIALPDSFLGPVRAWPRVGGTTTVRDGYHLNYFAPFAEVEQWTPPGTTLTAGAGAFTLRGYLYRITDDCPDCAGEEYLPLPPDQMRFAFTVLGPVDRPPTVAVRSPAAGDTLAPGATFPVRWDAADPDQITQVEIALVRAGRPPLALALVDGSDRTATVEIPCTVWAGPALVRVTASDVHGAPFEQTSAEVPVIVRATACNGGTDAPLALAPNPSRGATRITGPAGRRVAIHDLAGRLVRELNLDGGGSASWDGLDRGGRRVRPGIYLVRGGTTPRFARLVRIE